LSENAAFARAVLASGLIWIGPEPGTIELMGDKQRARDAAIAAGVSVLPGSRRFEPGELEGLDEAGRALGFPLLAKAAGGGGGIGMRRVDEPDKLCAVVEATQSMARKAFGTGAVYLERYIERARHVEVQLFGFGNGAAVHLYERDCSLQRRFQKVIEETPAPGLARNVSRHMCELALSLARATKYQGAGTVEFIVDTKNDDFYFLEMNTRIQVEHPVTEMATQTDIVALQIELARGRLAPFAQDKIRHTGAAIEARLYAENPAKMFMPSPGRLTTFCVPESSENVRVDSGYREGDTVTPYYDPLLAKVIGRGRSREEARVHTRNALCACRIDGIATNLAFLIACLENEAFVSGDVHTGFIDSHRKSLIDASANG
jgi:3-methylcrotonyl-CoA carboxylase alpha subunit